LLFLASLHVLSPEFDPSWRIVSEYALGNFGWVLSLMFVSWAVSWWRSRSVRNFKVDWAIIKLYTRLTTIVIQKAAA